jgi:hypothetical protein
VKFTYSPREPGIFRGEIKVETTGKSFIDKIDVNATCVEFLRFIINEEGEELSKIEFGTVLFGQKKKLSGHLVNNSPEGFYFRIIYLPGLHVVYKEENNIMTPHEQGVQQTRRLLQVEPSEGFINSYDQIPLVFTCRTWVEDDHQICTRNYAMGSKTQLQASGLKEDMEIKEIHESIKSTAILFFKKSLMLQEPEENRVLMMQADATCPRVSFSQNIAEFGKVNVGKESVISFEIQNDCKSSEVRIASPKTSVYSIEPAEIVLQPGQVGHMKAKFSPKNFGKVVTDVEIKLNKYYSIPFRFIGSGTPAQSDEMMMSSVDIKSNSHAGLKVSRSESRITLPPVKNSSLVLGHGQSKMPDYLKENRQKRLTAKKEAHIKQEVEALEARVKEMMPRYTGANSEKEGVEAMMANELKYIIADNRETLEPPRLDIPKEVDSLFVSNPLASMSLLERTTLELLTQIPIRG